MKTPVLGIDMWLKLHKEDAENDPEWYTFPMTTERVISLLNEIGVYVSPQIIERSVKTMELVVPKFGRTRAWGRVQIESLIEFIVSDDGTDSPTMVPAWMRPHVARLWELGISADDWCRKHMAFLESLDNPVVAGASKRLRQWFEIPLGAKLVVSMNPKALVQHKKIADVDWNTASPIFEFERDEVIVKAVEEREAKAKK